MKSREVVLASRPVGMPKLEDFEVREVELPNPGAGEVLVRNVCMSVDPYMRGRMIERKSYIPPIALGDTLTGGAIGRVERSNHTDLKEGTYVESHFGWREAFVAQDRGLRPLGDLKAPASAYLGVLGMPGMTAYGGILDVGELKEGEAVFVSGAAGAVGSAVGQIAKIKGATVVGSAGSTEKVRHLTEDLGFDHAFDYHDGHLERQILAGAPEGVDVYFDNVGGDHLQAALNCMRPNGRIALCGAIAQYNATAPVPGPNNLAIAIGTGLTIRGFTVSRFDHLREDFMRDMTSWIADGRLKYRETTYDGIDNAAQAFIGLFTGANTGKMVVNL